MINPVLTALFDLFLVGSASTIIAGMVQEYLASRTVSVGSTGRGCGVSDTRSVATAQARRQPAPRFPAAESLHRVA